MRVLKEVDDDKIKGSFGSGPRTRVACFHIFIGNYFLCFNCTRVYREEKLFWKQGNILED